MSHLGGGEPGVGGSPGGGGGGREGGSSQGGGGSATCVCVWGGVSHRMGLGVIGRGFLSPRQVQVHRAPRQAQHACGTRAYQQPRLLPVYVCVSHPCCCCCHLPPPPRGVDRCRAADTEMIVTFEDNPSWYFDAPTGERDENNCDNIGQGKVFYKVRPKTLKP